MRKCFTVDSGSLILSSALATCRSYVANNESKRPRRRYIIVKYTANQTHCPTVVKHIAKQTHCPIFFYFAHHCRNLIVYGSDEQNLSEWQQQDIRPCSSHMPQDSEP